MARSDSEIPKVDFWRLSEPKSFFTVTFASCVAQRTRLASATHSNKVA
jgi:hypothetical protein